jgi:hypothetical protein
MRIVRYNAGFVRGGHGAGNDMNHERGRGTTEYAEHAEGGRWAELVLAGTCNEKVD